MTNNDTNLKKVVEQETAYLRLVHPTPEELPSCTSILDDFLLCSKMRNGIRDVYRYGERRDCSSKWEDYKYCMSLKRTEDDERYNAWIQRRATWWAKRRVLDKSSEDVWAMREEPMKNYPPPLVDQGQLENKTEMWSK